MPRFTPQFFPSTPVSNWATGKFGVNGWYPAAPIGVTPVEGDQQVALSWDAGNANGSDIIGYKVEKNDGSWSTVTSDTGSTATSYTVTGLTNGTAHTFRVTAINKVGEGETPSSVSASKTPRGVPGAPGTLSLAAGSAAQTEIDLSWSAPGSTNGAALTGYKIQYSTDGSSWSNVTADTGSTATTYTISSLTLNTRYWVRVAAINVAGAGSYGNEPDLTTANMMAWSATGSYTTGTDGSNTWVKWTSTGTLVTQHVSVSADIFVLGGGGSGSVGHDPSGYGGGPYLGAGGGGGGGAATNTGVTVGVGTHVVTIGAGGASSANNGSNSTFAVTSAGGSTYTGTGGGAGNVAGNGGNGGCGGGAGSSGAYNSTGGTGSQGYNGGGSSNSGSNYQWGGGGGGMGSAGTTPAEWAAGTGGGDGSNSYTGSAFLHSGGGGAATRGFYNGTAGGTTGTAGNRGGGSNAGGANTGGGTGASGGTGSTAGVGGSGAAIIRFLTP